MGGVFVEDPDAWLWMALLMLVCAPVVLLAPVPVSELPAVLLVSWPGGAFVDEPDAWLCTALETLVCAPVVSLDPVPVPALPDVVAGCANARLSGARQKAATRARRIMML